jgi:hypothetical protein
VAAAGRWTEFVANEPDGHAAVVVGGLRAYVKDDLVTWADDGFASAIHTAVRTESGWVFVAADGAAASSATFLGPLRRMQDVPPPRRSGPGPRCDATRRGWSHLERQSRGRAAFADADGTAWSSDGREEFRAHPLPRGQRAHDLRFVSARVAMVQTTDGILVSEDAGDSWRPRRPEDPNPWGPDPGPYVSPDRGLPSAAVACWSLLARDPARVDVLAPRVHPSGALLLLGFGLLSSVDASTGAVGPPIGDCMNCQASPDALGWSVRCSDGAAPLLLDLRGDRRLGEPPPSSDVPDVPDVEDDDDRPLPAGVALPSGAAAAVFADDHRGLAWGVDPVAVQRTTDGGRSWEPIALPIDGLLDADALGLRRRRPRRCTALRCLAGERIVVPGWGPLAPDPPRLLARRAPPERADAGAP